MEEIISDKIMNFLSIVFPWFMSIFYAISRNCLAECIINQFREG